MTKKQVPRSFVSGDANRRKSKGFHQINAMIDWTVFEKERYKVCNRSIQDAAGRPAYNPLILFKIMLLRPWYNLSDMVNDTLSTNTFCGLRVEDTRLLRKRVTRSVDPVWGHF